MTCCSIIDKTRTPDVDKYMRPLFSSVVFRLQITYRTWFLGDSVLKETDSYTHLGIVCNKNMRMKDNVSESAVKIRKTFFGLMRSGF